jgi:hypothetical protein
MPVGPATKKTEIRRIVVRGQSGKKIQDLISKITKAKKTRGVTKW